MQRAKPTTRTQRADEFFDAAAANRDMVEKLRQRRLRRRASSAGFELRHSAYGYALVGSDGSRVDGRNDLTLDDVQTHLDSR